MRLILIYPACYFRTCHHIIRQLAQAKLFLQQLGPWAAVHFWLYNVRATCNSAAVSQYFDAITEAPFVLSDASNKVV